jgi:curved DNA-binding protein CbpA
MVKRVAGRIRGQNQYDRLQLNPGATQGQVYMRYRELAEVFHPDRANEEHLRGLDRELAEIFECVEEAYETLGHEDSRKAYDRREMMGWRPGSASASSGSGIPTDDEDDAQVVYGGGKDESPAAALKRAKEMIASGNNSGAIATLDQAMRVNPDPTTLLLLARLELKNPILAQRAVDHLRHAVSLNSRLTEGWLELAAIWKSRNEIVRYRECMMRVLSYDPNNRDALDGLAGLK